MKDSLSSLLSFLLIFHSLPMILFVNPHSSTEGCVPSNPPVAVFTYSPSNPKVNQTIVFNASASYDPDGYITSYLWNFGDDNITETLQPIIFHAYELLGNYSVSLTVIDNSRLTNSTIKILTITKTPIATFTYLPLYPQVGETIVFNASDSRPDGGHLLSYAWDFGDGNFTVTADSLVTHAYSSCGLYTVILTVTDSENESDIALDKIRVWAYPKADFACTPLISHVCENVEFDASFSTPNGGEIVSYQWDFGDSTHGQGIIVTHHYTRSGNYTVTLNITDSEGKSDIESKTIEVLPQREDLNEDGRVDIMDLALLCKAYGSYPGHPRWDPKKDVVADGIINVLDAVKIARAFRS